MSATRMSVILSFEGEERVLTWSRVMVWRSIAEACYHRQGKPVPRNARQPRALVALLVVALCTLGALLVSLPGLVGPARVTGAPAPPTVWEALRRIQDPEINANIVELGLVRRVTVTADGAAEVILITTSAACPFESVLASEAAHAVREVSGVTSARVVFDRLTVWHPGLASPELRSRLGGR